MPYRPGERLPKEVMVDTLKTLGAASPAAVSHLLRDGEQSRVDFYVWVSPVQSEANTSAGKDGDGAGACCVGCQRGAKTCIIPPLEYVDTGNGEDGIPCAYRHPCLPCRKDGMACSHESSESGRAWTVTAMRTGRISMKAIHWVHQDRGRALELLKISRNRATPPFRHAIFKPTVALQTEDVGQQPSGATEGGAAPSNEGQTIASRSSARSPGPRLEHSQRSASLPPPSPRGLVLKIPRTARSTTSSRTPTPPSRPPPIASSSGMSSPIESEFHPPSSTSASFLSRAGAMAPIDEEGSELSNSDQLQPPEHASIPDETYHGHLVQPAASPSRSSRAKVAEEPKSKKHPIGVNNPSHFQRPLLAQTTPADRQAVITSAESERVLIRPEDCDTSDGVGLGESMDYGHAEGGVGERSAFSIGELPSPLKRGPDAQQPSRVNKRPRTSKLPSEHSSPSHDMIPLLWVDRRNGSEKETPLLLTYLFEEQDRITRSSLAAKQRAQELFLARAAQASVGDVDTLSTLLDDLKQSMLREDEQLEPKRDPIREQFSIAMDLLKVLSSAGSVEK